jgi:hypothetical protein
MILSSRVKAAVAAVTVAGATAAALLVPASPAVAFSSGGLVLDVVVQSPAHLIAKGAALALPVEYTCFGTSNDALDLQVSERVGNGALVTGQGQLPSLVCTGEIQQVKVDLAATGNRAFAKGSAFVSAQIFGCSDSLCGQDEDDRTITIQK